MEPDHEQEAEARRIEIYRAMSPAQKWQQAWLLRESAWALKRAGLVLAHPEWSQEQVEESLKKIFLYAST